MFERFTERARRALFFARYEVAQLGDLTIETEHLLLGVLRESKGLVASVFAEWNVPLADLRRRLEAHARHGDKVPTSVEVPFSGAVKRVLNFAAEEADRLLQPDIKCEHLLLALLRESHSYAAETLTAYGLTLNEVRTFVANHAATVQTALPQAKGGAAAHVFGSSHIQRIGELIRELANAEPNSSEARAVVERIDDELMMLQTMLE
jgi:ATP-dependent Clp protease ATP-binding subunit ClpC